MNKRQKEVQQTFLDNEKEVLKKVEANYQDALDEIDSKIELLLSRQDADMQHVIYQVEYQKALKTQVQAILEQLQANEFETVSEYLAKSYEDGFIGTMYDLQGSGIPLVFPIDQEQVVEAVQHETKLSESLYTEMGKDIKDLQKKISGEISRGISTGMMYSEISRNIAGWARIPKNRAMTIARTEAHRIQTRAAFNAQHKAKSKGADVVKQWDASLDKKTRASHRRVDGEFRELDEPFSNGLMYPGDPDGRAEEVINCRCALLQRARWALDNDYTKWSPDAPVLVDDDGTTQFTIIEAKNYEDFKKQYNNVSSDFKEYRIIGNVFNVSDRATVKEAVEKMPKAVKEAIKDVKIKVNSKKGSGYDEKTGIIHLAKGASKIQVSHEVGHAIENILFDKVEVDNLKRKFVHGLGISDIKKAKATDANGKTAEIYILKSNKFINGYQTRLYGDSLQDCIDKHGNIDIDKMDEFISVAFEYYMNYNNSMKKHFPEMYEFVRKAVNK